MEAIFDTGLMFAICADGLTGAIHADGLMFATVATGLICACQGDGLNHWREHYRRLQWFDRLTLATGTSGLTLAGDHIRNFGCVGFIPYRRRR